MRKALLACVLLTPLLLAGCLSTESPADDVGTVEINETIRDRLIDQETERIQAMLAERNYTDAGIGGSTYPRTEVLRRNASGTYLKVSVPYYYTSTRGENRTLENGGTAAVTADLLSESVYLVNASGITRVR